VRAHWALYCENYLEGFHIPYVHAALATTRSTTAAIAPSSSPTRTCSWASPATARTCFDIPPGWPDHGTRVAAFYFWLFPNTMINVYPWGISVNVVKPLAVDRTKVSFLTYVWDASRLGQGAGSGLDRVEREDEAVVESVQRGVRSRLYASGRYSVAREQGVHHFHRLLAAALA
jgi:choline monooxygenase